MAEQKKKKSIFALQQSQDFHPGWKEPEDWKKKMVETAGFVPLEVRFQRLIESGQQMRLRAQEFDSVDMRKLYLDDEYRIEPDDELEDIYEKMSARKAFIESLRAEKAKNVSDIVEKASQTQEKAFSSPSNDVDNDLSSEE